MGVYFENIILPKDQNGKDIPGIVGYEILRGSREGNKTIIAKGMVNNFRSYKIKGNAAKGRTGLYANYPFNTINPISPNAGDMTGYDDPYMHDIDQTIPQDIISFHSPDTMFRTPFLSTTELKLYGNLSGFSTQQFIEPDKHPKFKLLADAALIPIFIVGLGEAIISLVGKKVTEQPIINSYTTNLAGTIFASGSGTLTQAPLQASALTAIGAAVGNYNTFFDSYYNGVAFADALVMINPSIINGGYQNTQYAQQINTLVDIVNFNANNAKIPKITLGGTVEMPAFSYLPAPLRVAQGLNQAVFYFSEGADVTLQLIYALLPYRQYALQQIAHGFYSGMNRNSINNLFRFKIEDSFYIRDNIQEVPRYQTNTSTWKSYNINNLKRPDSVVVRTKSGPYYNPIYPDGVTTGPALLNGDKSLVTLGTLIQGEAFGWPGTPVYPSGTLPDFEDTSIPFSLPIQSHYAGIKGRVRNQYGQLNGIKQITITPCEQKFDPTTIPNQGPSSLPNCVGNFSYRKINRTPILFNGDTYINRYTEKNTMCFYNNWLYGQPDGFEYNYYLYEMIPQTRFNVNSIKYDVSDMAELLNFSAPTLPGSGGSPTRFYNLDYYKNNKRYYSNEDDEPKGFPDTYPGVFGIKQSKFY